MVGRGIILTYFNIALITAKNQFIKTYNNDTFIGIRYLGFVAQTPGANVTKVLTAVI